MVYNTFVFDKEIYVYLACIKDLSTSLNVIYQYLSKEEILRANKFMLPQDKLRFILGRFFLKSFLLEYYQIPIEDIIIKYNEFGKPFISNLPQDSFNFNISHSNEIVVLAFYQNQIGIDIEYKAPIQESFLSDEILTQDELLFLYSMNEASAKSAFYKIWTDKEAYVKCLGVGCNIPFNKIKLHSKKNYRSVEGVVLESDIITPDTIFIHDIPGLSSDYCGAVATTNKNPIIKVIYV